MSKSVLDSLVRVHRWALDEKRRKLTELDRYLDKMKADLRRLDDDLEVERRSAAATHEASLTYHAFLAAALQRRDKVTETIGNLEREAAAAGEEVAEAFRELKRHETARDRMLLRESETQRKREQIALDEMGLELHQRRAAGARDLD